MLRCPSPPVIPLSPKRLRAAAAASVALLAGCGGGGGGGGFLPFVPAPAPAPAPAALACDESLKTAFKPDANTTVTLVRQFKKGDDLNLDGTPSGNTAANDLCLVKLNVGPGNPGPADAPSTSPGIGIEVWLPAKAAWNNRLHVLGGGGFVGDPAISALDRLGGGGVDSPAQVAGTEGSVNR